MSAPTPGNWQASLRSLAATALLVAIGLHIAASLIRAVAPVLMAVLVVAAVSYGIVSFERYRRSRW